MPNRFWSPPAVKPEFNAVLGRLGYNPKLSGLDETTSELISREIQSALPYLDVKGVTQETKISAIKQNLVVFSCGLEAESERLAKVLAGCTEATLLACTIGNRLKELSDEKMKAGEMTSGVILDAIGSEAVEAATDFINEVLIRERRLKRQNPTMRFSPGYSGWKTDIHPAFLKLLESDKVGIACNPENFLLLPEKSITAVIGWKK